LGGGLGETTAGRRGGEETGEKGGGRKKTVVRNA